MFNNYLMVSRRQNRWPIVFGVFLLLTPLSVDCSQAQTDRLPNIVAQSQNTGADRFLPGLVVTLRDESHSVKLIAPAPNFYLEAEESLHPSLASNLEIVWMGYLTILRTADYQFSSGSAELYISGRLVGTTGIHLETGRHPIQIIYRRKPGKAFLHLDWKSDHFPLEPIGHDRFNHTAEMAPSRETILVERGRLLVEEFGCLNCHRADSPSLQGRLGPDLTDIAQRVSSRWLYHWLGDPSAYRSGSVMPRQLDKQQRSDVTTYLLSLAEGGDFEHQRMSNERGPYFGRETYSTIGCAACHDQPGLELEGMGSKMSVSALQAYLKNPLQFDSSGRMPSMRLSDEEAFNLATLFTRSRNEAFEQPWQPGDAARGRVLIETTGCLSCHALEEVDALENKHVAPRLEQLSPERGCLASKPLNVPAYRFTEDEKTALKAFLRAYRSHPDRSPAPDYHFRRRLVQLRCVACHETDLGDPTGSLAESAPSLSDAGFRLQKSWIDNVMTNHRRTQTEKTLRMPDYDPRYVAGFSTAIARASGVDPGNTSLGPSTNPERQSTGVRLLTGQGCIGCHGFGEHPPLGEEGPHLTRTGERLRFDWFQRWMRNPARILSGTSMPDYFSSTDPAEAESTILTLWAALSMGDRMPIPEGLRTNTVLPDAESKPTPNREAIIVRWFMPEATPSAIAVGLPGKVSYCFDAGESRLRYAWLGGFVDMSGTLSEKRDPATGLTRAVDLIGTIFYRSAEFPLRVGNVDSVPQPRFRGYRLIDGHPQFHYEVNGIDVYERVVAADENRGIVRQFTIPQLSKPAWFLLEASDGIKILSSLGQPVHQRLSIPQGTDVRFSITITKEQNK